MLLTSGGASRGDEDHVVEALNELGNLHMWQIAIKPGRPMSFGQINNCVFAGLPGNPVAVFVCFLLYVRPILIRLSGGHWPEPRRYPLRSASRIERKKSGRREYWRATTIEDETEGLKVCKFPRDGSGLITSLRAADGLVEIDEDITQVSEGDLLKFIPFTELGLKGA
jgi:molybdopterin molybdotransferase